MASRRMAVKFFWLALRAGLNAIYVPHAMTWHLEHEEVLSGYDGRLLVLEKFEDLRKHF